MTGAGPDFDFYVVVEFVEGVAVAVEAYVAGGYSAGPSCVSM